MPSLASPRLVVSLLASVLALACSADDERSEVDRLELGASCQVDQHCAARAGDAADGYDLRCFGSFADGHCGLSRCSGEDCPDGSACISHDDGQNYCFRLCDEDSECNLHRSSDAAEARCSSSVSFLGATDRSDQSACVPPVQAG